MRNRREFVTQTEIDAYFIRQRKVLQKSADDFYALYQRNKNLNDLLTSIDIGMSFSDPKLIEKLELLSEILSSAETVYSEKILLISQREDYEILIITPDITQFVVDFTINDRTTEVSTNKNHEAKFIIRPTELRSRNTIVNFRYNIEKSFRFNQLSHPLFIQTLINTYLQNNSGSIEITNVVDSRVLVRSRNFTHGIETVKNALTHRGWSVTSGNNYTHIIDINKVIIEEKRLNIGTYYVKAHLQIDTRDSRDFLISSRKSEPIEAIDSHSIENALRKVSQQLIPKIVSLL
jgi:hypothetical protein